VLNVSVPKVSLQRPRIVPFVGQRVTTGMPEHVRVRREGQLGLDARPLDHLGLPEGTVSYGTILLGYPAETFTRIPVRKTPDVTWL
jgi:hypothetical protein